MIDLDEPMFTLDAKNNHVLTPIGQKVVDWAGSLPVTSGTQGIPGRRQEAAVCKAFVDKFNMQIEDFKLSTEDFNHVMAANGPPRYDLFTGTYYDYGAHENGHPSGELICTDQSLIVEKGSKDGQVPPPEMPPPESERPPTSMPPSGALPDRDGQAKRDERQAGRQVEQDARQAKRDERQTDRQTKRDDRRDE